MKQPDDTREFKPRDWSPAERLLIKDQVRTHARLEAEGWVGVTAAWRKLTLRDTSDCSHTSGAMFEVENAHGVWGIIICVDCGGIQDGPECPHVHSTWHEDDMVLICDNCGIDGT